MVKDAWESYGEEILVYLNLDRRIRRNYKRLFRHLHERDFEWIMERDENRAYDGVKLRKELGFDHSLEVANRGCSVLEMLAGLAIRTDDEIIGDPGDPRPGDFFWEMIENLALENMSEKEYDEDRVDRILDRWMGREFLPDGRGSIFRVGYNTRNQMTRDMRELEIWDQMNAYVYERYR